MWITFIIYKVLWCRIDNAIVFYTLRWFCSLHYLHTNLRIIKGKQKIINTRNGQMQELLSAAFHIMQNLWKVGSGITIQNLFFSISENYFSVFFSTFQMSVFAIKLYWHVHPQIHSVNECVKTSIFSKYWVTFLQCCFFFC